MHILHPESTYPTARPTLPSFRHLSPAGKINRLRCGPPENDGEFQRVDLWHPREAAACAIGPLLPWRALQPAGPDGADLGIAAYNAPPFANVQSRRQDLRAAA